MKESSIHSKQDKLSNWKKYHKWPSLFLAFFLLLFSISGIVLNHRDIFSAVDINRKFLPPVYRYDNWNLAAIKSATKISRDSILIFGNVGVWITDADFSEFKDFNHGFPKGIDNRKIYSIFQSSNGQILAGTLSGLYRFNKGTQQWDNIILPIKDKRIVGFAQKKDRIYIMGRSDLFILDDLVDSQPYRIEVLPAHKHDYSESLFRTLWVMHSGKIFGTAGQLLVDLMAIILIFLTVTGLIYFFVPKVLRKLKEAKQTASRIKKINRFSIKWHNRLGYYTVIFLLLISFTGIFLRPPFLIPIANIRVPAIKYTWLDNPNPWFDKFRDILYDKEMDMFILSTSLGFYRTNDDFKTGLKSFSLEPPISVMGINVFERIAPGDYLVGSFSGIYRWMPFQNIVIDHVSGSPLKATGTRGNPFGNIPVAGYISDDRGEFIYEYLRGAINYKGSEIFPAMPEQILKESPISLWNLALEIHTGRIFSFILGDFYILYIPIVGIGTLLILVSGFVIYYRKRKKSLAG